MKKSILALSALAVAGGLGLAGSAQAVYSFGQGVDTTGAPYVLANTALGLELNPGTTGHELVVPYYSVQGDTATMINIVNTDTTRGKAVKVRFRGAANSDDVLDFTLLMSPGDVWNGTILRNANNGLAKIVTNDLTCTLPGRDPDLGGKTQLQVGMDFITSRFRSVTGDYLTDSQKAANTREGYVEILNMADIPPYTYGTDGTSATWKTNDLFAAVKHTKTGGAPACEDGVWRSGSNTGTGVFDALLDLNPEVGTALLNNYGLAAPTGGLTGGWLMINQATLAQFSGNDTAVRAFSVPSSGTSRGATGSAWVAFSPQIKKQAPASLVSKATADPLLTFNGGKGIVPPQWFDLPDLSTPMGFVAPADTPTGQAAMLAQALGKTRVNDEFYNDPASTVLTTNTDWIISQPTRRYFAVIDYATSAAAARIVYNNNQPAPDGSGRVPGGLPYAGDGNAAGWSAADGAGILDKVVNADYGPQACLNADVPTFYNQEEVTASLTAQFSPGYDNPVFCGEVATMTFGKTNAPGNSVLNAALTNTKVTVGYSAGWANFTFPLGTGPAYGLPVTGFAAISILGNGQSYGATWPLRW